MTTTTEQIKISDETINAILESIVLDEIESFDNEHDPEDYSTNIYIEVSIGQSTYKVVYQRGTDDEVVELAPWNDSGMADVYTEVLKLTGEFEGQDVSEVKELIDDGEVSAAAQDLISAITSKLDEVAFEEQCKYDAEREESLVETPEFGVDASGEICDVDSDDAVTRFNYANSTYGNMIQFNVSKKDEDGEWQDAGGFDCFHFHLPASAVYQRYLAKHPR